MKADEVLQWAKMRKGVFHRPDAVQQSTVKAILARFPDLVDASRLSPEADPFVVALAIARNDEQKSVMFPTKWVVVTQERFSQGRPKIPNVCAALGVECVDILEVFRREKWTFEAT
ncbi:MAG: DUF4411 family protein [Planctomycetia bacterium]|nr:DUF4411 family protein [Planctomycetia bacterium]